MESSSVSDYYQQSAQFAPVEVVDHAATSAMLFRLCLYGFFIELKPSEAYLNAFLTTDKGFTNQETNDLIYPWFSYGQLLMLVAMPLVVERFQYRTVLLIESIGFLFTRILLLSGSSLFLMQAMQVTYAVGTVSKVVYLCMIYREIKQEEYHQATAVIWTASLGGQFAAGLLGQVLVSYQATLWLLNYISLANVCVALCIAVSVPEHAADLVPPAHTMLVDVDPLSTYDTTRTSSENLRHDIETRRRRRQLLVARRRTWHWTNFLAVSWIAFKCCESLMANYIQNRWSTFPDTADSNGLATALYTASGALASGGISCLVTRTTAKWLQWYLFGGGVTLLVLAYMQTIATSLDVSYVSYVLYGAVYYAIITTVSAELAMQCTTNQYAKMFSIVALGAACLETALTFLLQGTHAQTTTWFDGITWLHVLLLLFYVFVYCTLEPEPLAAEVDMPQY
ncbi:Aste57867_3939 [Aphanomyces stellatus]|uniref:Aste57867_3939 protein n=1 Tax=Aphanomyces stellatus TaxID=120398 RepID=A0A485KBK5_9STRA|nr:hypothetical protein As57867_003928 [Aphanomyces stellatus]VFT81076.1 Aste57867_3939 [Aphanomyces stellatus]